METYLVRFEEKSTAILPVSWKVIHSRREVNSLTVLAKMSSN